MRKFKNTSTGELAEITDNPEFYLASGSVIPKRFIEDYCGWEEQPIEYNYDILSFSYPRQWNEIATLRSNGEYGTAESSNSWTLDELLNVGACVASGDVFVHSVRRKSDGSIFTVGERAKDVICGTVDIIKKLAVCEARNTIYASTENLSWGQDIENICNVKPLYTTYDGVDKYDYEDTVYWVISDKYEHSLGMCLNNVELCIKEPKIYKIFSTEKKALEYVESVKPKPLFTTEDGKDIFEGDTYYCVNTAPHLWSLFEQTAKERTKLNRGVKAFTTKELAEEFLFLKKPLLSLDDLLSVWSYSGRNDELFCTSPLFLSFKKLAKSKL